MFESSPIRLQVSQVSSALAHNIESCCHALEELKRVSLILFTRTPRDSADIQAWYRQDGFGVDDDGFWISLPLLAAFRGGRAPAHAVSFSWHPDLRDDPEASFRMYCLKDVGQYLMEARQRLPGTAWIYYQDVTNTSMQFPYIDQVTAITPDFDWSAYHTYVSVAPENNPQREIRWTRPTIDYAGEGLIISASVPVYLDDRFIGLWSIDLPMASLYNNFDFKGYLKDQVNFIIDREGYMVAHPAIEAEIDKEKGSVYRRHIHQLGTRFKGIEPGELLSEGSGRRLLSNSQGDDLVVWFEVIPGIQWIFFATVPRQSMEDAINQRIRKALDRVKSGDLSYRIKNLSEIDHARLVAEGFNQMASALENQERIRLEAREEKKRLEKRLQHFQRMEAIGTLAGGIAHDFNNILFPILGYSELLLQDLAGGSPEYEMMKQIYQAAGRARDLTRQILTFSRQTEMENTAVSFQSIVKEALKLLRASVPRTIEIHQKIDKDCPPVLGDATLLHQIIMNLCTNAFHAVEETDGSFEVSLKPVEVPALPEPGFENLSPGHHIRLTVSDNGPGMDEETLTKIFDPYFTTKSEGKGTGLGLAVTYGIVQKLNGEIKVYSETGQGTTFQVFLPVADFTPNNENLPDPAISGGVGRVLLVDDEESITTLGTRFLEKYGYSVTAFTDSRKALEAFARAPHAFDIVVTDMTMPRMTGDILAARLKELRRDIPVILCTGFSEKISSNKYKESVINAFLMKPISIKDIHQTIRKLLDTSGKTRGNG
ncbi:MAG: response regulator [Desulfobacter sp.]|nr:MAG: response regulator [Desulfobacter sp.]